MNIIIDLLQRIPVPLAVLFSAFFLIGADLLGKVWATKPKDYTFLAMLLGYVLFGAIFTPILLKQQFVIAQLIVIILNIIGVLLIGFLLFNEPVSMTQKIGIILGVGSIILLSI